MLTSMEGESREETLGLSHMHGVSDDHEPAVMPASPAESSLNLNFRPSINIQWAQIELNDKFMCKLYVCPILFALVKTLTVCRSTRCTGIMYVNHVLYAVRNLISDTTHIQWIAVFTEDVGVSACVLRTLPSPVDLQGLLRWGSANARPLPLLYDTRPRLSG